MDGWEVMLLESRDRLDLSLYQRMTPYLLRHLLSLSLCPPYRSGDLDSLPDLVIVAPLLDKSDKIFSFGVAIMLSS